jgi:alpha-L-arabinofuranosidase
VQKFVPQHYAAVPYLSVNASRSRSGKKIYLIIVNKHLDAPVTAAVNIGNFKPHRARAWSLTGPSVDATNEKEPNTVTLKERDLGAVKNGFLVEFAPHSMTAIELE